jgi:seryl-tRNA(Sec) selenium transferase
LKFQVNFKQRHEKTSILNERLHDIEYKLKNYRHPSNRQQYHETKHLLKTIADDLRHIDLQLQEKLIQHVNVESPICVTPVSAGSSGYGSDMN